MQSTLQAVRVKEFLLTFGAGTHREYVDRLARFDRMKLAREWSERSCSQRVTKSSRCSMLMGWSGSR